MKPFQISIQSLRPRTPQQYYRVAVGVFFFIQGLVFASWASRIPDVKAALGLSDAALGGVLFAIPAGQLSAMALSGWSVSRFGSRRMLLIAAVFYPLVLVGLGAATTVWELIAGLFFFGMGANLSNIAVNTQGVGVERLYGRSIMATFHGLWSLAGFMGGVASTLFVGLGMKPLFHFLLIFCTTTILLLLAYGSLLPRDASRRHLTPRTPEPAPKRKGLPRPDRMIVLLGVVTFGCLVCEGTMYDWSSVYFENVIRPREAFVRLGYIAAMCAMATGRFTADRFVTRFGPVPVLRISGMIVACGLLLATLFPHLLTATLGFLLVGFGVSSVVPVCYSMAGRSTRMQPSVALATVSTIGFLGFLIGPPVIGFISQAIGLRWALGLIAVVGLTTSLVAPLLKPGKPSGR